MSWFGSEKEFFGIPLAELLLRENPSRPPRLPSFVAAAVTHLVAHGLQQPQLFTNHSRASKGAERLRKKLEEYKEGRIPDLAKLSSPDGLADVATVLQDWLIALPEPLLPPALHPQFAKVNSVSASWIDPEEQSVTTLRAAVKLLPQANRTVLEVLCVMLHKYSQQHMEGLAECFGRLFCRPDADLLMLEPWMSVAASSLIKFAPQLFGAKQQRSLPPVPPSPAVSQIKVQELFTPDASPVSLGPPASAPAAVGRTMEERLATDLERYKQQLADERLENTSLLNELDTLKLLQEESLVVGQVGRLRQEVLDLTQQLEHTRIRSLDAEEKLRSQSLRPASIWVSHVKSVGVDEVSPTDSVVFEDEEFDLPDETDFSASAGADGDFYSSMGLEALRDCSIASASPSPRWPESPSPRGLSLSVTNLEQQLRAQELSEEAAAKGEAVAAEVALKVKLEAAEAELEQAKQQIEAQKLSEEAAAAKAAGEATKAAKEAAAKAAAAEIELKVKLEAAEAELDQAKQQIEAQKLSEEAAAAKAAGEATNVAKEAAAVEAELKAKLEAAEAELGQAKQQIEAQKLSEEAAAWKSAEEAASTEGEAELKPENVDTSQDHYSALRAELEQAKQQIEVQKLIEETSPPPKVITEAQNKVSAYHQLQAENVRLNSSVQHLTRCLQQQQKLKQTFIPSASGASEAQMKFKMAAVQKALGKRLEDSEAGACRLKAELHVVKQDFEKMSFRFTSMQKALKTSRQLKANSEIPVSPTSPGRKKR